MILATHDLRCHISRGARRLAGIVGAPVARNAEVRQTQVAVRFEHEVLRLDVAMDDAATMHSLQCLNETSNEELGLLLSEAALSSDVVAQVTSQQ